MPRRTPSAPLSAEAVDDAMIERRIGWLLRPLAVPPTTDARTIAHLSEVAADVRSELTRSPKASATERLLAVEALLRSRPLPAERGFSGQWTCWDWAARFMRSAEARWHKMHPAS